MEKKIGIAEKLGYTLIGIADNIRTSFTGTLLMFFCTNVLLISPGLAGTLTSVTVVWDAINDLLIANYADNHPFKNGERVRKYLIYASIPLAILLTLMFTKFTDNVTVSVVILMVCFLTYTVATTFHRLPYFTMSNLVSPNEKDRIMINTWLSMGGIIGVASGTMIMWPIVRAFAGTDENGDMINAPKGFFCGALIIGLVVVLFSIFNYATTRERVRVPAEEKFSIKESLTTLMKYKSFRWNLFWQFSRSAISAGTISYAVYYVTYILKKPGLLTVVYACYMTAGLLVLPFMKKLVAKLGRTKSILVCALVYLAGAVVFIIMPTNLAAGLFFCMTIGAADQLSLIVIKINRANISDTIEIQQHKRMDNMISNASSFMIRCAGALLALVFGWILEFSGYNAELSVQPHSAEVGLIAIMGGSALLFAGMLLLSTFRMKIDKELESVEKPE